MPHPTVTPLVDGQTLAVDAGPVTVAVQCIRLGQAYRLSIRYGSTGAEVDELSRSVPSERQARSAARMAGTLFRGGVTVRADPDLLPVGHAFLDGVRLALAADLADGR